MSTVNFCIHKAGKVVRTGQVPSSVAHLQAHNEGEHLVIMSDEWTPDQLYVDESGIVRSVQDDVAVAMVGSDG